MIDYVKVFLVEIVYGLFMMAMGVQMHKDYIKQKEGSNKAKRKKKGN